jgi:uncharacterized protein (TIGR02466 family)
LAAGRAALAPLYEQFAKMELSLQEFWAIVAPSGTWLAPHHHFPARWSGVFWVATEDASGDAGSAPDGRLELMNPLPIPESFAQPAGIAIKPRDGVIVLFPGVLNHFVHPNQRATPRISLSFNLDIAPRRPNSDGP